MEGEVEEGSDALRAQLEAEKVSGCSGVDVVDQ